MKAVAVLMLALAGTAFGARHLSATTYPILENHKRKLSIDEKMLRCFDLASTVRFCCNVLFGSNCRTHKRATRMIVRVHSYHPAGRLMVSLRLGQWRRWWGLTESRLLLVENYFQYPATASAVANFWTESPTGWLSSPHHHSSYHSRPIVYNFYSNHPPSITLLTKLTPLEIQQLSHSNFVTNTVDFMGIRNQLIASLEIPNMSALAFENGLVWKYSSSNWLTGASKTSTQVFLRAEDSKLHTYTHFAI